MDRFLKQDAFKLPNLLSIFRIILIPLFLYLFYIEEGIPYAALCVLAVSFLSDVADGFIARRFNMITELGKLLDPLADKATQVSVILLICIKYSVPIVFFLLILAKEVTMGIGALYIRRILKGTMISANYWGKSATGLFYLSSILIMMQVPYDIGYYGMCLTIIIMACAFVSYTRFFLKVRKETKK